MLDLVETVTLSIVQPRDRSSDEPIKTWEISASDVLYWGLHVLKPAAAATEKEDAPLAVGDHCKFCPAIAICPEQLKNALAVAQSDFEPLVMPDMSGLNAIDIAKVMAASKIIAAWAGEVEGFAKLKMLEGMQIPGFKLVKSKTNRKWIDAEEAGNRLSAVLGEDAFDKKVIGIVTAEKKLKLVGGDPVVFLDGLWEKPEGGVTIAPETDRRGTVDPPAVSDFLEHADFLQ